MGENVHAGICLAATALLSILLMLPGPVCSRKVTAALDREQPASAPYEQRGLAASQEDAPAPLEASARAYAPRDAADVDADAANTDAALPPFSPPIALGIGAATGGTLLLVHRVVRHAVRDGITEAVLLLEGFSPNSQDSPGRAAPPGSGTTPEPGAPTPCGASPACPGAPRCGRRGR